MLSKLRINNNVINFKTDCKFRELNFESAELASEQRFPSNILVYLTVSSCRNEGARSLRAGG